MGTLYVLLMLSLSVPSDDVDLHNVVLAALQRAQKLGMAMWVLIGLIGASRYYWIEGKHNEAINIAGLVDQHPEMTQEIREHLEAVFGTIAREEMAPRKLKAQMAKGAALDLNPTVASILAELEQFSG